MVNKELIIKHGSKLYKGFCKQCERQEKKPNDKKLKLRPAINLPKNFKGTYKHFIKVRNIKWNGMNLKSLRMTLYPIKIYNGMYSKFYRDVNGMVKLSRHGKQILEKKRKLLLREY